MTAAHAYVDGIDLTRLMLDVRSEFLRRPRYEPDGSRQPNSVRLVAIDVLAARSAKDRRSILDDLDGADVWLVGVEPSSVFAESATPRDFLTDLVCEVVDRVLRRDETIRAEDDLRMLLAATALGELEQDY